MNTRTTFIVLLIALALAGYFLVVELGLWDNGPPTDSNARPGAGVALIDQGDIPAQAARQLRIEQPGEADAVIERIDGRWRQTQPVQWALEDRPVEQLIDAALLLAYTRKIDDASKAKAYGLAPPRATITLMSVFHEYRGRRYATEQSLNQRLDQILEEEYPSPGPNDGDAPVDLDDKREAYRERLLAQVERVEAQHTIKLGRTSAAGRAFTMIGDDPTIYVTGARLHELLTDRAVADMRRASLQRLEREQLRRIELTNEHVTATMQRDEPAWRFTGEHAGRVKPAAINELVDAVNGSYVERFVADQPDDLAAFGLAEPTVRLTLHPRDADAQPHVLTIGQPTDLAGDNRFAMWGGRPVVFTVPESTLDKLDATLAELRDDRLTPTARNDVNALTIEHDGRTLEVVRTAGVWSWHDDQPFDVEPAAVDEALTAIFNTRATSSETGSPDGEPMMTITLAIEGRDADEVLRVYPGGEGSRRVLRHDEPVAAVVTAAKLAALERPVVAYRDRTVLDVPEADIRSLAVERRSGRFAATFTIQREGEDAPLAGEGLDDRAIAMLANAFSPLRAVAWRDAELGNVDARITITTDNATHTVHIDRDQKLAKIDDHGVFELATAALESLTAELRPRTMLEWSVDRIASVRRGELTVKRDSEGNFTTESGDLPEAQSGKLFDTLAGLRAQRFTNIDAYKIDRNHPTATLTITSHDGEQHTLRLWAPSTNDWNDAVARIDQGAWFTLDGGTFAVLAGSAAEPRR